MDDQAKIPLWVVIATGIVALFAVWDYVMFPATVFLLRLIMGSEWLYDNPILVRVIALPFAAIVAWKLAFHLRKTS